MGRVRKETSFKTSTKTPPRPNIKTGPKVASLATPMIASTPGGAILCTDTPSISCSENALAISRQAALTSSVSFKFSLTPPASDLCTTSAESTFMAAGEARD